MLSHVRLSSTTSNCQFYWATRIVLCTHRCNRLNYRTASIICYVSHTYNAEVSRTHDKQTSMTTNVVDDKAYSSTGSPSWTGRPWRIDTQIYGGKTYEPETSRPVAKRSFYLHHLHLVSPLELPYRTFVQIVKLRSVLSCNVAF